MKINTLQTNGKRQNAGFTLIEMIGVLAVIAILAALLLPKVANAINDAKVNSTVGSIQGLEAATTSHYGKYLAFNTISGTTTLSAPYYGYDTNVLVVEGFLDHNFAVKVGTNAYVNLMTGATANNGIGYNFIGASIGGTNATTTSYSYVVEAVIQGVQLADAQAIDTAIDGAALSTISGTAGSTTDTAGKCTWTENLKGGTLNLYIDGR